MNVLFCTQSESLPMFHALWESIKLREEIGPCGFIVADSMAYARWLASRPGFESGEGHCILKEWEVTDLRGRAAPQDPDALSVLENTIGGAAGLFGAIVADRRLFMGPDCTYTQDYRRRYSDEELLTILTKAVESVERMFDKVRPDLVVGFICVTMLDYVAYLVARRRGVPVLNLRPTRVGDRISFGSTLNDPSPEFAAAYARVRESGSSPHMEEARRHIRRVREEHGRYEGVVRPSDRPAQKAGVFGKLKPLAVVSATSRYLAYRRSSARHDNHVPDPLRQFWFSAWRNPRLARRVRRMMSSRYATLATLGAKRFVFFPLHTEPEVSLLVYGRPYVNQIEVIRMLALSLPLDTVLVVKEHPWMVGKRSISAYEKMLNIPRLHLADPRIEARDLASRAALTVVITGSVALEAAILGRPVLTFGECPYNLLPDSMVRRISDPRRLPEVVRSTMQEYRNQEHALEAYIAAVFETSAGVNLYSVLLGKKNVHVERPGEYSTEISKLTEELLRSFRVIPVAGAPGAAAW